MKERPILFSPTMVRALLDGRKTQTRRAIKPQPELSESMGFTWKGAAYGKGISNHGQTVQNFIHKCPYGKVGDRLWVKEGYKFVDFHYLGCDDWAATVNYPAGGFDRYIYQCDAPEDVGFWPGAVIRKYEGKMLPSIFMYRWVSRITLEITDVRVERVQDINEKDAVAEGLIKLPATGRYVVAKGDQYFDWSSHNPVEVYQWLWKSINGEGSWEANPWVWCVSFTKLD